MPNATPKRDEVDCRRCGQRAERSEAAKRKSIRECIKCRVPRVRLPMPDRFWAKVDRSGDGCWEWQAAFQTSGYGRITIDGRMRSAHRLAYELANGPVPANRLICHHCDNRRCVRPDHLYAGTPADNSRDMTVRGRHRTGRAPSGRSGRKLTPRLVEAIRASIAPNRTIAAEFGVTANHVRKIRAREIWRNVP